MGTFFLDYDQSEKLYDYYVFHYMAQCLTSWIILIEQSAHARQQCFRRRAGAAMQVVGC